MSDARVRLPLVLVTVLLVQLTLLTRLRVFGVVPDTMLLLAVAAGITGGRTFGAVVGFSAGMAIDLFLLTPMGLSALVFSLVGYVVGSLQDAILRSAWWIPVLTAFVASAAGEALFAFGSAVVGDRTIALARLAVVVAVVAVWNAVLAPGAIRLLQWALVRQPSREAYAR